MLDEGFQQNASKLDIDLVYENQYTYLVVLLSSWVIMYVFCFFYNDQINILVFVIWQRILKLEHFIKNKPLISEEFACGLRMYFYIYYLCHAMTFYTKTVPFPIIVITLITLYTWHEMNIDLNLETSLFHFNVLICYRWNIK